MNLSWERDDPDFKQLENLVSAVAYQVSRHKSVKGFAESSDIAQVIWEWVWRNEKKVARWRADHENGDGFTRLCGAVFRDVGIHWARREKATRLGYKIGDEFWYTRDMLKELLPSVFDDDAWTNPPKDMTGGRTGKTLDEGFGWVATLADISRSLDRIPHDDQFLLARVFGDDAPRIKVADEMDVSRKTIDNRVDRAVARLWEELGGPKWLTGHELRADEGRKSEWNRNANAVAVTESDWSPRA